MPTQATGQQGDTPNSQSQAAPGSAQDAPGSAQNQPPQRDEIMDVILEDLGRITAKPEVTPAPDGSQKPKDGDKTSDQVKPDDQAKPADPKPADKPVSPAGDTSTSSQDKPGGGDTKPPAVKVGKRKSVDEIIDDAVNRTVAATAKQTQKQDQQPTPSDKPKDDKPSDSKIDTSNWLPEEIEELELAQYAEKRDPQKWAGLPQKIAQYKKKVEEYIDNHKDDEERTFDESDEEFSRFIKDNRPVIPASDRKALSKLKLLDEVNGEVEKKISQRTDEVKREVNRLRAEPIAQKKSAEYSDELIGEIASVKDDGIEDEESKLAIATVREIAEDIRNGHYDEASQHVYGRIVSATRDFFVSAGSRFTAIAEGASDFDPNNQTDQWLGMFVMNNERQFEASGGDMRVRKNPDGSTMRFTSRKNYAEAVQRNPDEASKLWCFSDDDVRNMLKLTARNAAIVEVAKAMNMLKKSGANVVYEPKRNATKKPDSAKSDNSTKPQGGKNPDSSSRQSAPTVAPSAIPPASSESGVSGDNATHDMLDALGVPKVTRK